MTLILQSDVRVSSEPTKMGAGLPGLSTSLCRSHHALVAYVGNRDVSVQKPVLTNDGKEGAALLWCVGAGGGGEVQCGILRRS